MSSDEPGEAQYDAPVLDHPFLPENIGQEPLKFGNRQLYGRQPVRRTINMPYTTIGIWHRAIGTFGSGHSPAL